MNINKYTTIENEKLAKFVAVVSTGLGGLAGIYLFFVVLDKLGDELIALGVPRGGHWLIVMFLMMLGSAVFIGILLTMMIQIGGELYNVGRKRLSAWV